LYDRATEIKVNAAFVCAVATTTKDAAPTDALPVVRYDAKAGERSLDLLRWGLVPYWAKDIKVGFANINAKAEGIEGNPAFREAFQRRRCLMPRPRVAPFQVISWVPMVLQRYRSPLAAGSEKPSGA
jgi:putative SOS response-associated peptidase YedK